MCLAIINPKAYKIIFFYFFKECNIKIRNIKI